jgi:hypothetical protein
MNFGIENGKFYIEHTSCSRPPGTLREESDRRAREIYTENSKIALCLSSGLDSQIALHSFKSQGIPIECFFLRMGGFNENEYENLKVLEKKYGFSAEVIDINPNDIKEELLDLTKEIDAHANHCLQYKFVSQLPKDYAVIQVLHDPWIITSKRLQKHYVFHGYYDPEIARYRALCHIERSAPIIMFGDSSEYFLSSINDEMFHHFLKSWIYYDGNGLMQYGSKLNDVLRYEYYIKPMLYSKHWGDDLIYFPKFSGYENIDWLYKQSRSIRKERMAFLEWGELIQFFLSGPGKTKRWYEFNVDMFKS